MTLTKYENQICEIDSEIFAADEYCFSVLARILKGECRLTLTDKKRLVICHSCDPYPVWIWMPDDATEAEKSYAYETVKACFGFDGTYRFNAKYSFAEYMITKAAKDGITLEIAMNMLAYNCLAQIPPKKVPEGQFSLAKEEDAETAVAFRAAFHEELKADGRDEEAYRARAEGLIAAKRLFFWKDGRGEKVSMCSYEPSGNKGSVGNVFTRKDKRCQGYAAAVVYETTKIITAQGLIPVLYTDADYAASNACYEKIGYKIQGSLCTVGAVCNTK